MTWACWWLVAMLSRWLDADECDAVLGDLAESGAGAREALRDLAGLVARRQAALWRDWRPWVALVALVFPVGLLNSLHSLDRPYGLYLWVLRNYKTIDPAILQQIGLTWFGCIASLVVSSLLLVSWSWINGLVLALLSRRTVWLNGVLFCLLPLLADFLGAPQRPYPYDVDGWIFPLAFYTVMLPLILQLTLVLLPAVSGLRRGLRHAALPLGRTILLAAAVVAAITIRWRGLGPLTLALHWPIVYLSVYTIRQHWRGHKMVSI